MKALLHINNKAPGRRAAMAGFTLLEMMVVSVIFILIIGALVCTQVFGLRVYTLAATKLSATTSGREALNAVRDQIRSAKTVYVGTYVNGTFSMVTNGPQIGNALKIFSLTNLASTNFLIIYQNPASNMVFTKFGNSGTPDVVARYMTNYYCFRAEDIYENVLTNNQNNSIIRMELRFFQWEYPIGYVGTNAINAYDYYYLRTRVSRRQRE